MAEQPLLFIDVDGVISTYGFAGNQRDPRSVASAGPVVPGEANGRFHMVDGILHHIGAGMSRRVGSLLGHYECVWATGWGERANDHLVHILAMPGELEVVEFEVEPSTDGSGHWKLNSLTDRAADRPAAWIDDGHNEACHEWAAARNAPTLLISTDPFIGLTDEQVDHLISWSTQHVTTL